MIILTSYADGSGVAVDDITNIVYSTLVLTGERTLHVWHCQVGFNLPK